MKNASIRVVPPINIKRSSPKNELKIIYNQTFNVEKINEFFIEMDKKYYTYLGKNIDIKYSFHVTINDGIFFKTTKNKDFGFNLIKNDLNPEIISKTKELIEPKDYFNFFKNFKVIPIENKIKVLLLCIFGSILIGVNTIIGWHDEKSPNNMVIIYSHKNSEGEEQSPFLNSLYSSGVLGITILSLIKKYMSIKLKNNSKIFKRGDEYSFSSLIEGKSRIDLEDIKLKVVEGNVETGEYTTGSGKKRRTHKIYEPFNGIIVFEENIKIIPKGVNIENYILGKINFDDIYNKLLPELKISPSSGIGLHCEIQLIHEVLVDQEIIIPSTCFNIEDFEVIKKVTT